MERFKNKNILIVGGASGMGAATAMRVLKEGGTVIIADLNESKAKAFLASSEAVENRSYMVKLDATDMKSVDDLVTFLSKQFNAIHGVVNCIGIVLGGGKLSEATPDIWKRGFNTNLESHVNVIRETLPLLKREGASIVNISSDGALKSRAGCLVYDATKSANISVSKSLAAELVGDRIRVNAVAPGWVVTEFHYENTPNPEVRKHEMLEQDSDYCMMRRLGRPEEVAAGITFLLSDDASYITGITLSIDGGRVGF